MKKYSFILLTAYIFAANSLFAAEKPQKYMPYPILFVSGIGTINKADTTDYSPSARWSSSSIYQEFMKYYLYNPSKPDSLIPKYEFIGTIDPESKEKPHLEFLFYNAREAPVDVNARILKKEIEKILDRKGGYYDEDKFTYTEPCSKPKVILVCHSLGGIIARYMLVQNIDNIRDKVAAVFFLGTPQLGSPVSVMGYFIPKEIPYLVKDIKNVEDTLRDENFTDRYWDKRNLELMRDKECTRLEGDLKFIKWAETTGEGGLNTSIHDYSDYRQILGAIQTIQDDRYRIKLMSLLDQIPFVSQKGAVLATLIPDPRANIYRRKFYLQDLTNITTPMVRYVPEDKDLYYDISKEAVLANLSTEVGIDKVYSIIGTESYWLKFGLEQTALYYMEGEFDINDYSVEGNHLWEDGDGVISLESQGLIGIPSMVKSEHARVKWKGIPAPFICGEPDHPSTPNIILQAIDDKPVIEDVRIVISFTPTGSPEKSYFIVKAKDYLLADIEFETSLRYADENASDYYDPVSRTYRPYFKFGKDFLKERTDTTVTIRDINGIETPLKLYPGEFYLKITGALNISYYYLYLKIKNPAKKTAVCEINYYNGGAMIYKNGMAGESRLSRSGSPYYGPMWYDVYGPARPYEDLRWQGYNEFVSSPLLFYTPFTYSSDFTYPSDIDTNGLGVYLVAWGEWKAYTSFGYVAPPEYADRAVGISMYISTLVNMRVYKAYADPDSAIRSAKFIGYLDKELKGGGADFTISVSRDTSNIWPPTKDSRGDSPIFSFDTKSYQDGASFEAIIDPTKLNPGGNNVWQVTSDIPVPSTPQDNRIPESVPNHFSLTFAGLSRADFARSAYIRNPLLIVIYE